MFSVFRQRICLGIQLLLQRVVSTITQSVEIVWLTLLHSVTNFGRLVSLILFSWWVCAFFWKLQRILVLILVCFYQKFNSVYHQLSNFDSEVELNDIKETIQQLMRWGWKYNKNLEEQAAQLHMLTGWSQIVEVCFILYIILLAYWELFKMWLWGILLWQIFALNNIKFIFFNYTSSVSSKYSCRSLLPGEYRHLKIDLKFSFSGCFYHYWYLYYSPLGPL